MAKLINISEASSIAIHSLALIANSEIQLNATQIADNLGFSRNHMSKVMQILVKNKYLESSRGPKGGFILKNSPDSINLLEIYELIEGQIDQEHCAHNREECPFIQCVYGEIRTKLTDQFKEYFKSRKLSDILTKKINLSIC